MPVHSRRSPVGSRLRARVNRDGVVAAGDERLAVPGARSARRARGRPPRSARRSRRARSRDRVWKPATSAPPAPHVAGASGDERRVRSGRREERHVAGHHHRVERAPEVERREIVLESTRSRARRARAAASIDASTSTPTTWSPRRVSSIATRPVPQPASSTDAGTRLEREHERDLAVHVDTASRRARRTGLGTRRRPRSPRDHRGPSQAETICPISCCMR